MSELRGRSVWRGAASAAVSLALLCACSESGGGGEPATAESAAGRSAPPSGPTSGAQGAPVVRNVRIEPADPVAGETATALAVVSDPDGDPVELGYTWKVAGRVVPAAGGREMVVPGSAAKGQPLEVEIVASDGRSTSAPAVGRAVIGNRPPGWQSLALEPEGEVPAGTRVVANAHASDPDGDPVRYEYRWFVDGRPVDEPGDSLSTVGLRRGAAIRVEVITSDGERSTPARESEAVRVGNGAPAIVSSPPGFFQDGVYRYTVVAEDPDGDRPLRYRLAQAPAGMQLDPVGELVWRPDASQVGTHIVEIAVSDRHGGEGVQRFELVVGDSGKARTGG